MRVRHTNRGFTLIELLIVITIISILMSLLLPALVKAREMARKVRCASNMRQLAMTFFMFADEHGDMLPPPDPNDYWGEEGRRVEPVTQGIFPGYSRYLVRNNYAFDMKEIWPDYVNDIRVAYCPSQVVRPLEGTDAWYADVTFTPTHIDPTIFPTVRSRGPGDFEAQMEALRIIGRQDPVPDPECMSNQNYVYLPYAVVTEEQALWLWNELDWRMFNGEINFMTPELVIPGNHAPGGRDTYYRLRLNVGKVFIKNIDNPGATVIPDTQIPVLFDTYMSEGYLLFNHESPLGGNILFLDGHVESMKFPDLYGRIPYTRDFRDWTVRNAYDDSPLLNIPPWCGNRLSGTVFEPRYWYYPNDERYKDLIIGRNPTSPPGGGGGAGGGRGI